MIQRFKGFGLEGRVELLVEVYVEELPAAFLLRESRFIRDFWSDLLSRYRLECSFDFFYTPNRLVFLSRGFPLFQGDEVVECYGPPVEIAYDSSGNPTRAMLSFIKKNGISLGDVGVAFKDSREVVYSKRVIKGVPSSSVIACIVRELCLGVPFPKKMRWGSASDFFVRPIRNVIILVDGEFIECDIYSAGSSGIMFGHWQAEMSKGSFSGFIDKFPCVLETSDSSRSLVTSLDSYLAYLGSCGVVLDQLERKGIILDFFRKIESEKGFKISVCDELLDEVVALTEYPTVLCGSFDTKFLELPSEIIISSMKDKQRYFPVFVDGKLHNGFVFVSNAYVNDFTHIVAGNEKVLRARLSDAEFFYKNDLESKFDFGDLASVSFIHGAGSLREKVSREKDVSKILCNLIGLGNDVIDKVLAAIDYAKNDLLSQVVSEFPDLQGIMGARYAEELGFDSDVVLAIREQFIPNGKDPSLPSGLVSSLVNISVKIDSIFAMFDLGMIPSGSKDPYALRRQASSVIKICHNMGFDFSLSELCVALSGLYHCGADWEIVKSFIEDRFYGILSHVNPSVVRSVLVRSFGIHTTVSSVCCVNSCLERFDIKSVVGTFKRVSNVLDVNVEVADVDTSLFCREEMALYDSLQSYKSSVFGNLEDKIFAAFSLKGCLDDLFSSVLINDSDYALRVNRTNLIRMVYDEFLGFADMREISV